MKCFCWQKENIQTVNFLFLYKQVFPFGLILASVLFCFHRWLLVSSSAPLLLLFWYLKILFYGELNKFQNGRFLKKSCLNASSLWIGNKYVKSLEKMDSWFVVTVCNNTVCWLFQNYGDTNSPGSLMYLDCKLLKCKLCFYTLLLKSIFNTSVTETVIELSLQVV